MNEALIEKVKQLGLNSYEAKIWTALLMKGVATSAELAEMTGVPRSRTYDVLESLEQKGFVVMKLGKPIKYLAIPPREVIERVKQRLLEEARAREELLEEFKRTDVFKQLTALHDTGVQTVNPEEYSAIIKGRRNILTRMGDLVRHAQAEILLSMPSDLLIREKKLITYYYPKNPKKPTFHVFTDMTPVDFNRLIGDGHIRYHYLAEAPRVLIKDGEEVVFSLYDSTIPPGVDAALWLKSPNLAATFAALLRKNA